MLIKAIEDAKSAIAPGRMPQCQVLRPGRSSDTEVEAVGHRGRMPGDNLARKCALAPIQNTCHVRLTGTGVRGVLHRTVNLL